MQAQGIFNLSVAAQSESRRGDRIGLLRGRTGVPIFLLFLEGLETPKRWEMHTLEDVESAILGLESARDKMAMSHLKSFFEAQGTRAFVAASPLSRTLSPIASLMGEARSLTTRSGVHLVKDYVEVADLLSVPQASELLKVDAYRAWIEATRLEVEPLQQFFTLLDLPKALPRLESVEAMEGLQWSDSAFYYPWIVKDTLCTAPSPMVAALYQLNDREFGIQEIPANRAISGKYRPLQTLSPFELKDMQDNRINCIHEFGTHSMRIWGGRTASDPQDADNQIVSNRRTLLAVRAAVHELCERFVMEPLGPSLAHEVELQIASSFQPILAMFAGNDGAKFEAKAEIKTQGAEDVLFVNVKYTLPFALDSIHFDLGLAG